VIAATPCSPARLKRRIRNRRIAKIVVATLLAVIWIPVAIVLLVAGTSDRRR
jgi:hypothetical protein